MNLRSDTAEKTNEDESVCFSCMFTAIQIENENESRESRRVPVPVPMRAWWLL